MNINRLVERLSEALPVFDVVATSPVGFWQVSVLFIIERGEYRRSEVMALLTNRDGVTMLFTYGDEQDTVLPRSGEDDLFAAVLAAASTGLHRFEATHRAAAAAGRDARKRMDGLTGGDRTPGSS